MEQKLSVGVRARPRPFLLNSIETKSNSTLFMHCA